MSRQAPMSDEQRAQVEAVVEAVGRQTLADLREQFHTQEGLLWLPPPLLTVAAALIEIIVAGQGEDGAPWAWAEPLWEQHLPERRPSGRAEWRNANYALYAAGCLAAGVWLDVGRQESFWNLQLWPFALDLIELLTAVAVGSLNLSPEQLAAQLQAQLAGPTPPSRAADE
jgi:hypothetical protein